MKAAETILAVSDSKETTLLSQFVLTFINYKIVT